jgi:hypothetical protein
MKTLVVYESWFGNTRRIAEEIAAGLEGEVDVVAVDKAAPPLEGYDLLVVGAPTHVHGLSGRRSRQGALEQGGHGEPATGVREWIAALPNGAHGPKVATFDTRLNKPVLLVGSAARGIARRIRQHGYTLASEPESFFVHGAPAALDDGELERAAEWGRTLRNEVPTVAA